MQLVRADVDLVKRKGEDDSIEREFRVLGVQLSRVSQSFHALADALARERVKRIPSGVAKRHAAAGPEKEAGTQSLAFPEEPFS